MWVISSNMKTYICELSEDHNVMIKDQGQDHRKSQEGIKGCINWAEEIRYVLKSVYTRNT